MSKGTPHLLFHHPDQKQEAKKKIVKLLTLFTPDERKEILTDDFCLYCWDKSKEACYCTRDD